MATNTQPTKDAMSRAQAAEYIGIGKSTLDRLNIPRVKVRKRVLYRREAIAEWILKNQGKEARK
jgi:hypothetical protein